jgi:hypothetical protein
MEETMGMEDMIFVVALNILAASVCLGAKWFGTAGGWWPR